MRCILKDFYEVRIAMINNHFLIGKLLKSILFLMIFGVCGLLFVLHAQEASVLVERAKTAIDQNDIAAAIADLNQAVSKEPSNAEAFTQRARAYFLQGKDDLALADAEKALNLKPQNMIALNVRGLVKYNKKDYAGAVADYTQAVALEPQSVKAYYNRFRANVRLNANEKAIIADYLKVKEIDPNFSPMYQAAGYWCLQTEKYGCRAEFEALIKLEPNNDYGYFGRGVVRLRDVEKNESVPGRVNFHPANLGEAEKALIEFNKAIEINPQVADYCNARGRLQFLLGENDQALADLNKALALNPKHFQALINRGIVQRELKKYDIALKDFAEAESIAPKHSLPAFERALLYREMGNSNLAADNISIAISRSDSPVEDYYVLRGLLSFEKEKYAEAVADFKKMYQSDTKRLGRIRDCINSIWAEAEVQLQDYQSAESRFRGAIINSRPKCVASAKFGYASLTLLERRPDVANDQLNDLEKLNPNYPGLAEKRREVAAALPAYRQMEAEWEAKRKAEYAEWERKRDAFLAQERRNSSSNSADGADKRRSDPAFAARQNRALERYDEVHSEVEGIITQRASAVEKYNNAGQAQFLFKGTLGRIYRLQESAARTIETFLDEHGKYLPKEYYRHMVEDYRTVGGLRNFGGDSDEY